MNKKQIKAYARNTSTTAPDVVPEHLTSAKVPQAAKPTEESVGTDRAVSRREEDLLAGRTTRHVDGVTIEENPRVGFEHLTAADDERPIKRSERTSQELLFDTLTGTAVGRSVISGPLCERHGLPDCTPCRLVAESLRTVKPNTTSQKRKLPVRSQQVQEVPVAKLDDADVARLRQEWSSNESSADKKRRLASASAETDKKNAERTKKVQIRGLISNIRKEYGYDARDLAKLLDRPGFNKTKLVTDYSPLTTEKLSRRLIRINNSPKRKAEMLNELMNSLPLKEVPMFSDDNIRSYKRYVSRNQATEDKNYWIGFENEIIRRAWDLGLLPLGTIGSAGSSIDGFERDLEADHNAELDSIRDTTVTAGFGNTPGTMWQEKPMNTFERGPYHVSHINSGDTEESSGATVEDNYDDRGLDE